ncbi:MAG TPA: hypothetical protein VGK87_11705 [Anaerolineae bacterium]
MTQAEPHKLAHTRFTLVLIFVLMLVFFENAWRSYLSFKQFVEWPGLPTALSPLYIGISSACWVLVFGACLFGISRLNPWAPRFTILSSVIYVAYLWFNRLAFSRSTEAVAVAGFHFVLTGLFLVAIFGTLFWPGTRRLFTQAREYLNWLAARKVDQLDS